MAGTLSMEDSIDPALLQSANPTTGQRTTETLINDPPMDSTDYIIDRNSEGEYQNLNLDTSSSLQEYSKEYVVGWLEKILDRSPQNIKDNFDLSPQNVEAILHSFDLIEEVYCNYFKVSNLFGLYVAGGQRNSVVPLDNIKFTDPATTRDSHRLHLIIRYVFEPPMGDEDVHEYIRSNYTNGVFILDKVNRVIYSVQDFYGSFFSKNKVVYMGMGVVGSGIPYDPSIISHQDKILSIKDLNGHLNQIPQFLSRIPKLGGHPLGRPKSLQILEFKNSNITESPIKIKTHLEALLTVRPINVNTPSNNRFVDR
jgi:hypothetical protein